MSDIGLFIIEREPGHPVLDIDITSTGIAADDGLETAVFISLFSDQRVSVEELPDFVDEQRGWWGDLLSDVQDDKIGSKLWLLTREKTTVQTLQRFIDYSKDALQWMIDDGVADEILVDAEYLRRDTIKVTIQINKPDGLNELFELVWNGQEVKQ